MRSRSVVPKLGTLLAIGLLAFKAVVAHKVTDDRPILLLDKALVVLSVHPSSGKRWACAWG